MEEIENRTGEQAQEPQIAAPHVTTKGVLEVPDEIPEFPYYGHIPLETLHNTRDLGHMPAADGRSIKPMRLIRSGMLHNANAADLAVLLVNFKVQRVIDFRTEVERDRDPDPYNFMPDVVFYNTPALAAETIGITRGMGILQDLKTLASYSTHPQTVIQNMYKNIFVQESGMVAYATLLEVLLEAEDGATLWHCTEGKDRAGLGSVVVEKALGVPDEIIKADYLATNRFIRTRGETFLDDLAEHLHILKSLDADVDALFYAFSSYYDAAMESVDAAYGSFDAYLEHALNFGPEKQQKLRDMYLE